MKTQFERFRLLREWLRSSDPVARVPLEASAEKVRSSVMAAIENEPLKHTRTYSLNVLTKDLSV